MKAIQFDGHGGPEVLQFRDVPDPEPGEGEILVRVEAASVNWADVARRRNDPYPFPTPLPFIPGSEVAGTVAALGAGVEGPPIGTEVFALVGADGSTGYAEYAVAAAPMVIPRPPGLQADEAAGIIVAGGTAMLLLTEAARLQPGESVLVEGAGGGVGLCAVQLAKVLGAGVVIGAAGSDARRAAALAAGADHVVDYGVAGWADEVRTLSGGGVDVVLECVGGPTTNEAFASLAPFGRMVVFGCAGAVPGALTPAEQDALLYRPALNQSVSGFNVGLYFGLRPERAVSALTQMVGHVAAGRVRVHVGARLPLSDAAEAHRLLEAREVTGKIVLTT